MKNYFRLLTAFLTITLLLSIHSVSVAQTNGPPPPPAAVQGKSVNPKGALDAGAPIGNGTYILFALAAAYAFRKVYVLRKPASAEE